ncbi:MAG: hypothetical protein QF471_01775 [Phycisphaerales bacterium]|jgi:small-conductance mechanosensitive channel|nr:hypothetical protein [Phycisphaerales bacterium]
MHDRANVGAIEAISELRGRCVEAGESIARTLDDCISHSARVLAWVQGPQAEHWKRQKRKREQKFASARSDLERAKIAQPDADPRSFVDQQRDIRRTKAALEEADQKINAVKRWSRELERQLTLLRGGVRGLASSAEADLPRAAHWLKNLEAHLNGYLEVAPPLPDPTAMPAEVDEPTDHRRMGSRATTSGDADTTEETER